MSLVSVGACRGRRVTGSVHVPRSWLSAKPSSFTSLRRSPATLGRAPVLARVEELSGARSGRRGVVWSEVKEEGRAEPGPGDMSGIQRPGGLIAAVLVELQAQMEQ